MSRRQLGVVFGILAALVAVWMALRSGGPGGGMSLDIGSSLDLDVSYVSIDRPGYPVIRLEANDSGWTVDGYPAEDSTVSAMLGQLDTLPDARLVARNPASHDRLGVADSSAARIELGTAGGATDDLPAGRNPDRKADSSGFRIVPRYSWSRTPRLSTWTAGPIGWRDLMVAAVDTAALTRFIIRRGTC